MARSRVPVTLPETDLFAGIRPVTPLSVSGAEPCWRTTHPGNTGPDFGKASPFGLLVVVLLLIATFGLVWSMNRHLNKLPESFDRDAPGLTGPADEGTGRTAPHDDEPRSGAGGQPTG